MSSIDTPSELIVRLEPAARPKPAVQILPALLSPPVLRSGIVERVALLDRLCEPSDAPVVTAVAPPGYGKTTLLATWAERDPRSFAWLTLDDSSNDPTVLLTYLVYALDSVIAVDPEAFDGLVAPHPSVRSEVRARVAASVASAQGPIVVVVDDAHLLQDPEGIDILRTIVDHLPAGSRFACAGRGEPTLPLARWRSEGKVLDIRVPDLRLDATAARELLTAAGMDLPEDQFTELLERTEGWPVGLYLAALARNAEGFPRQRAVELGGEDDRFLADYIRSEFLDRLPVDEFRFLIQTSLLSELSGPLCDAMLERTGSAEILEAMDASNLLLVPLDRQRRWYRYHHLFQAMLRHELDRMEPEQVSGLARRASTWCEENGFLDNAVLYAQVASAVDRVAEIVVRHALPQYALGRISAAQGWFAWLAEHGSANGAAAVLGAWLHLQSGRAAEAASWANVAEAAPQDSVLPDGSPLRAWVLTLRAAMATDTREMQASAERASLLLAPRSPFMAAAVGFHGLALLLRGNVDEADRVLADAVELGLEMPGSLAAINGLAFRATIAIRRERWDLAESMADRAMSLVRKAHLQDYALTGIVHAVQARVAVHRGDARAAAEALEAAEELLPLLTHAYISRSIQTRIELIHAHLALGDAPSAADRSLEVYELLGSTTGFDGAQAEADQLSAKVEAMRGTLSDAVHLTPAELRLLPMLVTQLSFREIGEHLFLSVHTVKAEAISIYRKLGVSSRTQAVERARDVGLLSDNEGELPS